MVSVNCFISNRCKDYHQEYFKSVLEVFLAENDIKPIYGCPLEPNIKGILSQNIINGMKIAQIFIAFITPSWREVMRPIWPKKEWELWREIKKNTFSYDSCLGISLNSSHYKANRKKLFIPYYVNELMSFSISDKQDDFYDTILAKKKDYELYINENQLKEMGGLLSSYLNYFRAL